jgi:ADP-ribose pyrophosphatase YjhB (NUDIX family)
MFEMALEDIDAGQQAVVIGDNPETDILGAHRAGITGILFDDDEPTPDSARDFKQPDATLKELSDLFSDTVTPWDEPQYPWPDEIRPGVSAVVLNDAGEVLLLKRADREQWALPTGTVERGEAVNEAIKREMLEETGLRISVDRLTGVYSHPDQQVFSYPTGRVVHFVTSCFTCTIEQGTPKADEDEALDVEFFDLDNLPEDILSMQPQWISDAIERDSTSIR